MNSTSRDYLYNTYRERLNDLQTVLRHPARSANASPQKVWVVFAIAMTGLAFLTYILRVVDFQMLWSGNHQHLWQFAVNDVFFGLSSVCLAAGMMFLAWKETDLSEIDHDIHLCDRFLDAARQYEQQCRERANDQPLDLTVLIRYCREAEQRIEGLRNTRRGILHMPKPGVILSIMGIIGMSLV